MSFGGIRQGVSGNAQWRGALSVLLVAAFLLQGFVTQRHIHVLMPPAMQAEGSVSAALLPAETNKPAGKSQLPLDRDTTHCQVCHAASLAGNLLVSVAPLLRVPVAGDLAPRNFLTEAAVAVSVLIWRIRGPPRD
jgi:hypothetical protein